MRCAVVDDQGLVVNVIMADVAMDQPPENCRLYEITPDIWVDIGWAWSDRRLIPPTPLTEGDT